MIRNKGEREYSVARGYVQSMYLIVTNSARMTTPYDFPFVLAFNQLAGFAAELYFKAFLGASGVDPKTLRAPAVRHSLAKLHQLCLDNGFTSVKALWIVNKLGPQHETYEFRYLKPNSEFETLDLYELFPAFSELDRIVDAFIGASKSRGLQPDSDWNLPPNAGWRMPLPYHGLRATTVRLGSSTE
ncbi:hypothetical protein [Tardiphaga sp. 768_D3_N2_1]|uniref:hypothetical protein n=1 Tax=Tardiphaga sp. 768_D3_N2_1 TaxID=3240783 RepID=UPI003F887244